MTTLPKPAVKEAPMKFTPKQIEVRRMMREGWELRPPSWPGDSASLIRGIRRFGMEICGIHSSTFDALRRKKCIEYAGFKLGVGHRHRLTPLAEREGAVESKGDGA